MKRVKLVHSQKSRARMEALVVPDQGVRKMSMAKIIVLAVVGLIMGIGLCALVLGNLGARRARRVRRILEQGVQQIDFSAPRQLSLCDSGLSLEKDGPFAGQDPEDSPSILAAPDDGNRNSSAISMR